jgi:hypothetical protein
MTAPQAVPSTSRRTLVAWTNRARAAAAGCSGCTRPGNASGAVGSSAAARATAATSDAVRTWLESVEAELGPGVSAEAVTSLAYVAGRGVRVDPEELVAARRRALLIVAAGGDPHRELSLDHRAVESLASDLDDAQRRSELDAGLAELEQAAGGMPLVSGLLAELRTDSDLTWRAYACALLAEELGGD